jgi:hypothetical protein
MSLLPADWRRFWVRADRDHYVINGFALAGVIVGYVSGSWHSDDRMSVLRNIRPVQTKQEQPGAGARNLDRLQDSEFIPAKKKVLKKYYQMDSGGDSSVPDLDEEAGQ